FRIEQRMVDDVIAVLAAGTRLEQWRYIQVADTQPVQIGHQRSGLLQRKFTVQLHPIRCARNDPRALADTAHGYPSVLYQRTSHAPKLSRSMPCLSTPVQNSSVPSAPGRCCG